MRPANPPRDRLPTAAHSHYRSPTRGGELLRLVLDLPVDLHELAYVIVRLIESYNYLDLITGQRPDATRAEPILRMLLR